MQLAVTGKTDADIVGAVSSHLKKLVAKTSETGFFSRLRNSVVDLVHVEVPHDQSRGFIHPGLGLRPAHACSSAKAIAAYLPESVQDDMLADDNERFNDATLTEREAVLQELKITRARGYAVCDEEIDEGVVSIAVPVAIESVGVIFSLGVVGPAKRLDTGTFEDLARDLKETAAQAARTIQHLDVWDEEIAAVNTA